MSKPICLFCNGKFCKYEDYRNWLQVPNAHPAIKGLYSNWIADCMIAMARPSERVIREHNIIGQFKKMNVSAVINCQQAGEHSICGDGLAEGSGFSYRPESFMDHGIFFYNFAWKDMTTPSIQLMLSIVQVVAFHIESGGRVAVHCHAGLGRTGLVCACTLIFHFRMSALDAVKLVRLHRPGSVQTQRQEEFLTHFHDYCARLRCVFAESGKSLTTNLVIKHQREILHGEERRKLRFLPKIVHEIANRLSTLARNAPFSVSSSLCATERGNSERVLAMKQKLNQGDWKWVSDETDAALLQRLMLDWFLQLQEPLITADEVDTLISFPDGGAAVLSQLSPVASAVILCFSNVITLLDMHYRHQVSSQWMAALSPPHLVTGDITPPDSPAQSSHDSPDSMMTPVRSSVRLMIGSPSPGPSIRSPTPATPSDIAGLSLSSPSSSLAVVEVTPSRSHTKAGGLGRFLEHLSMSAGTPTRRRTAATAIASQAALGGVKAKSGSSLLERSRSLLDATDASTT